MTEKWRPIPSQPGYEISRFGLVRGQRSGALSPVPNRPRTVWSFRFQMGGRRFTIPVDKLMAEVWPEVQMTFDEDWADRLYLLGDGSWGLSFDPFDPLDETVLADPTRLARVNPVAPHRGF